MWKLSDSRTVAVVRILTESKGCLERVESVLKKYGVSESTVEVVTKYKEESETADLESIST